MRRIELTQGYHAVVDDEDYEFLSQWKWFAQKTKHTVYAARKPWVSGSGRSTKVYMHRVISGANDGMQTDHMDGNGLNNRRANLRSVTQQDNLLNRVRWTKGCASRFRGVYLDKRDGSWFSSITVNGKSTYLGRFGSEEDAARAYLEKRRELNHDKFIREGAL